MKHYDREGKQISMDEWCKLHSDLEYKIVAKTDLKVGLLISTVWLGLDHSFGRGEPLIFESIVFQDEEEIEMLRYHEENEAIEGHNNLIIKYS